MEFLTGVNLDNSVIQDESINPMFLLKDMNHAASTVFI
jgi:hypothetical protein